MKENEKIYKEYNHNGIKLMLCINDTENNIEKQIIDKIKNKINDDINKEVKNYLSGSGTEAGLRGIINNL